MAPMNEKTRQLDFNWRYCPGVDTPDAVLLDYIRHHPYLSKKEVCLQALRAFWLPLALQSAGLKDVEELQRHGKEAIRLLENQAEHLRSQLGIEPPTSAPTAVVINSGSYAPSGQLPVVAQSPVSQGAAVPPPEPKKRKFDDSGFS